MHVVLGPYWEEFIKRLVNSGRYHDADEVVHAGLEQLEEAEIEVFPPGSLRHLYANEALAEEFRLAHHLPIPEPDQV
jgi:putative addiction module CopG family antidote